VHLIKSLLLQIICKRPGKLVQKQGWLLVAADAWWGDTSAGSRKSGSGRSDLRCQQPPRSSDGSNGGTACIPLAPQAAPASMVESAVLQCAPVAAPGVRVHDEQAATTGAVRDAAAVAVAIVAAHASMMQSQICQRQETVHTPLLGLPETYMLPSLYWL
jgi:hypothetical protein